MTEDKSRHTPTEGSNESTEKETSLNFIEEIITEDLATGKHAKIVTRFPPEPNGYLHIGHAKSICLNFGLAEKFSGTYNLRFDDTNPTTEEDEYVRSIMEDIKWLGFDWQERVYFASDYFEQFYIWSVELIEKGLAFVDSCDGDTIRQMRGNFNREGENSPHRNRSPEENLALLEKMRAGEFKDGECVLRAKVDMKSPNMNMRDPIIYRIRHENHHRAGGKWCIYPMYDFAHGLEDAIEGITHSICTLEFENHRPLYDWFLDNISAPCHPRQIEFARLNLSFTVMSKRKLLEIVQEKHVSGWDDPRMPTISGMRRRGYSSSSIRKFADRIGIAKRDSMVDVALLEHTVRDDLNETSPRIMAVLDPLKIVLTNFPEDAIEEFDAPYFPNDSSRGSRKVLLTRELFIERDDFREEAPKKWHRLAPGKEIRLRYACLIKCEEVIKDEQGKVVELRCTWDPESKGGTSPDGRKVKGTSHWVSAKHGIASEVRLYDRLFTKENPLDSKDGGDWRSHINPNSLEINSNCIVEPSQATIEPGSRVQFERLGYFCADSKDSKPGRLVFNRTVTLRDSWAKIERGQAKNQQTEPKRKTSADTPNANVEIVSADQRQDLETIGDEITIDTFSKLDLRVGVIREATLVEGAKKLLRLMVDLGEGRLRQVFAGIRSTYPEPEPLVGQKVIVVANLKPRQMKFGLSEGMVLAGGGGSDRLTVASFSGDLLPGDKVS